MQEPSPRGAHGFGYIDGKIVVFGGYGSPHAADADVEGMAPAAPPAVPPTPPEQPLDDLYFLHLRWVQASAGVPLYCGGPQHARVIVSC